mmetsp:Transcript_86319/g.239368  ORF Transcript_86319/g.239368 Transcript_86319/m.239368 type:complete len:282 (-) Transcript_86319:13-858(-)
MPKCCSRCLIPLACVYLWRRMTSSAVPEWMDVVASVNDARPLLVADTNGMPFDMGVSRGARKIAVLDSSFNPPTLAHERLLQLSDKIEGVGPFDFKLLMLAKSNADKAIVGAQLHERLAMMQQVALAQGDGRTLLAVTAFALFVDKARALLEMLAEDPAAPLSTIYFIVGSDTIVRIFNPKYYKDPEKELGEFFRMAHLISFDRDEATMQQTREKLGTPLGEMFKDRITLSKLDNPYLQELSSTMVRQALVDGQPLSEMLLPGVEEFVRQNEHMYAVPKSE